MKTSAHSRFYRLGPKPRLSLALHSPRVPRASGCVRHDLPNLFGLAFQWSFGLSLSEKPQEEISYHTLFLEAQRT